MCGILALLSQKLDQDVIEKLLELVARRGPDYSSGLVQPFGPTSGLSTWKFAASLLHLRGQELERQPVIDSHSNVLLFNGQIYLFDGQPIVDSLSDTRCLYEKLNDCKSDRDIADVFSKIDGPFAIVYWSSYLETLFFGRDIFGRKSLCLLADESHNVIAISSVAYQSGGHHQWQEVDCSGVHSLDLSSTDGVKKRFHPRDLNLIYPPSTKCIITDNDEATKSICYNNLKPLNHDVRQSVDFEPGESMQAVSNLRDILNQAIAKRLTYNKPECLICRRAPYGTCLHSKVIVAFSGGIDSTLIARILHEVYDKCETIDLSTVAFKKDSPDRQSVVAAFRELRKLCPERRWRLIFCDVSLEELQSKRKSIVKHLSHPCDTVVDDSLACASWFISRARGRSIDSSMPDDEFEAKFDEFAAYNQTSDVATTSEHIISSYQSPATMIFSGSGIDEQLGGYSSHKAAFSRYGNEGVYNEICFQMRRLSTRNLGRDDRTYSDHGRDVKLPYLDFDLVSYLNSLPIGVKTDLSLDSRMGPKKLLRMLVQVLGLVETAQRVKRAMQFGTRIANLEGRGEKAHHRCSRLTDDS